MTSGLESEFVTLHEIVKAAKIRLNPNIWDYLIGGTETETTLRRNRLALDTIAFKPRVLRDVSTIDPSSEILGKKIRLPVMLAPVGSLESFEAGGGITVAQGAGASNVAMLISSVTTLKLQDIVKGGAGPKIYQLYVRGDDAWVADRVKEAMDAGYDAFCITVDTQVYSRRERDIAKRFVKSWPFRSRSRRPSSARAKWQGLLSTNSGVDRSSCLPRRFSKRCSEGLASKQSSLPMKCSQTACNPTRYRVWTICWPDVRGKPRHGYPGCATRHSRRQRATSCD